MLSVANVRTAGGAANYFAADNYYTRADADRSGEWLGKGADRLGLRGPIEAKQFEAVLKGLLPDGSRVGSDNRVHRAGTDLTFSMPKSWSILALVGGDKRILDAYAAAVRETLFWAEKNLAETRMEVRGKERVVTTGNLVVGLFQHDTNRNQEPNAHLHAVVANVTQGPDGKWRALRNDKLWEHNTLLNAMTMARFRLAVEKLGYEVGEYGKHGNFEAVGVPKAIRDAFSSRRAEILDRLATMEGKGLAARNVANLMTRAEKGRIVDRDALARQWGEAAAKLGFDPAQVIARANARAAQDIGNVAGFGQAALRLVRQGSALAAAFATRLGLRESDPLLPARMGNRTPEQIAAVHAVASAIRHLGEREAAFTRADIFRAALGFALPTSIMDIENRVDQLLRQGHLLKGKGADRDLVTTRDALGLEQRIIAAVESGRGLAPAIVPPDVAGERLQALSQLKYGMTLNPGQEGAGRLLVASHNRIVAIQGVAGAGKSTVLKPVADVLREEGRAVLGLAVQNTLVQMLERETGIPSMTVSRFLRQHRDLLEGAGPSRVAEAKAAMRGTVVLLDEASMVGNADKEKLVRLANLLELDRFASIGDRKQLGAVDAGKPFDVMQQAGVETAIMSVNLRAREKALRDAQYAAQGGHIDEALRHLGTHVVEAGNGAAVEAAAAWLSLSPAERETTSIYASGRALRGEVNEAVQTGLKANGELGPGLMRLGTLSRINVTREELRYARSYAAGTVSGIEWFILAATRDGWMERKMNVSTLLIDACPKENLDFLLECTRDLNQHLNARVSGVSYAWPNSSMLGAAVASPIAASREEAQMKSLLAGSRRACEAAFPELQSEGAWHEGIGEPAGQMLDHLFCTDLLATIEAVGGPCVQADPVDLAVHSGTPVLRIKHGVNELPLRTAVVAWKDGAPANRAIRAARPLLALANVIHVVGVGDEVSIDRLDQVAASLQGESRKIEVSHLPQTRINPGDDIARQALALDADLVVSGVKGERSLRERLLGDVTDKLAGYTGFSWLMCA